MHPPFRVNRTTGAIVLLALLGLAACEQRHAPPEGVYSASIDLNDPSGKVEDAFSTVEFFSDGTAKWTLQIGEKEQSPLAFDTTWRVDGDKVYVATIDGREREFRFNRADLFSHREPSPALVRTEEIFEKQSRSRQASPK